MNADPSRHPCHSGTAIWSRLGIGAVTMLALMLSTAPGALGAEATAPAEPVLARSLSTAHSSAPITTAATDNHNGMTYSYDPANVGAGATVTGYDGTAGTEITIGDTVTFDTVSYDVTAIGNSAFLSKGITTVAIPDTVTSIGGYAFWGNQLTTVTIPDAVTTIGSGAFQNNHLTSITIGVTVTAIGDWAFADNQLTAVTTPDSVTTIGSGAFAANRLATITIGDSVTTISDYAFIENQLTAVTIGDSVTTIGQSAFASNKLTTVDLGNSVTVIGLFAFIENQLTTVTVPDSVTTISPGAFTDNAMLATVVIEGTGPTTVSARGANGSFGSGDVVIRPECAYQESFSASWFGYTVDPAKVLTFDLNGHGSAIAPASTTCGVPATAPSPPTEPAWVFTGWYTDADLSTRHDFSDPVTGDLILYAGWGQPAAIAGSNTVTFTVGETAAWTPTSLTGSPAPTVTADTLPDGLILDEDTGAINGTPTTAGVTVVSLTVNNGIGDAAPLKLTITVKTPITSFTLSTDKSSYTPGAAITITGGGLPAGTTVAVSRHSTPISLGSATTTSGGHFTLQTTLPADTSAGEHEIVATATVDGRTLTATAPITVTTGATITDTAALPDTGANQGLELVLLAGILFLATGMVLIRRRSPAEHATD